MPGTHDDLYDGHYQTEYKGPVGFEKKLHKTHFAGADRPLRHTATDGYAWIEKRPGRWIRIKTDGDHPVHDTA